MASYAPKNRSAVKRGRKARMCVAGIVLEWPVVTVCVYEEGPVIVLRPSATVCLRH